MTILSPNPTTRSFSRMASDVLRSSISHPDRRKEHREEPVHHDHREDGFHDRRGRLRAERFGAAFDLQPFDAGDDADDEGHERRLDHSDFEVRNRNRLAEARGKYSWIHAAIR